MFEERAKGGELLDAPDCDPHLARESYCFMEGVNRLYGGTQVILNALSHELRSWPRTPPVRILDIGSGGCDIPLAVVRWGRTTGRDITITCVDHNTEALDRARSALIDQDGVSIALEQADIFHYKPPAPFDFALASMVLHHFSTEEIDRLIAHLRGFVRRALIVNDLRRSLLNYLACWFAVRPCEEGVRHDALLSIRRGFTPDELRAVLRAHDPAATVETAWFCRVVGALHFDSEAGE